MAKLRSDSWILALDVGTSSLRAALVGSDGRIQARSLHQEGWTLDHQVPGQATFSPTLFAQRARRAVGCVLTAYRAEQRWSRQPIVGVSMSCFWHSLIGLDEEGSPLTPVITWADGRARDHARAFRDTFNESEIHQRTGCMLRTSFWPAKLAWLRQTDPRLFESVRQWTSPGDWLLWELFGVETLGVSMASGTGLWGLRHAGWDQELLAACHVGEEKLGRPDESGFPLAESARRKFPELGRALVFPAMGDGAASNLGSGATLPERAAINFGTSGAARVILPAAPDLPFGLFGYRVDPSRWLVGGAISNAGNLRAWGVREWGFTEGPAFEKILAKRPGPVEGLTVLPFWTPERAPTWCEDLTGTIVGISAATTKLDLFQAVTDATYLRLAQIIDKLPGAQSPDFELIVSGGIQKSVVSLQRLADVIGRPLRVGLEAEASLRGAALSVWEQLGRTPPEMALGRLVHPDESRHGLFLAARKRQQELEEAMAKSDWMG